MSVDILAIGENNRKKLQAQQNQSNIINPWRQTPGDVEPISPKTKAQQTLDKQVEIGLGTRLDNVMTNKDKQLYADGLDEGQWNLMQRYKAEGYSFEASKAMVEQNKELLDPYAQGINKFKDYQAKEQYYNNTGGTVDPNSNLYKIGTFLQKIGFDDQYGNPLNKLATQYNEWYMNEREAMDYLKDNGELNLLERFGWWLERGLLSAESGIISGLGKIGNAVQGVEDIKSSAMDAALDRAILGYDTDLNFYRETDRRLDEYAWEGISGGLNTIFRAMAPKMMTAFSYIGETEKGGKALTTVDDFIKGVNEWALENITEDYWNSLDEQGKEDLLDTMTTLEYMYGAKKVNNRTAKLKTTKIGSQYETLKAQNRAALERGFREAKNQAKAEVKNVKNATEVINGNTGKVTGKIGPEGEVGVGKSISRVVDSGVQGYKQYFIDRLNARHSGGINTPGTVPETGVTGAKPTEVPTKKGGIKEVAKQTWDNAITGLTPEERIRIQNDPYVADKFNKALAMINEAGMPLEDAFITEQLYNEIGDKIKAVFDERENKLGETSPYYREIRNNPTQYNLVQALPEISTVLTANDIVRDPISGELDFTNSKFVSDADMRSVQRALNMIEKAITKPLTPREYLNLRDKLKQLASYATVDASRGQSLIRQLRHTVNEVAHKTIPGLKDLDKVTSKYFNEIAELKDGWVYKGGDRKGEVRNNFYSIIKNLTGQNRKVMLDRLEKYYPGVGEEIEAIHIVNKMVKAYNKSPQMIKSMGIGGAFGGVSGGLVGGGIVGALIGAIAGEMVNKGLIEPWTKKRRKLAIEKLISQLSPEAQRKLEAIAVRQMTAKEISAEDQAVLDKVAEIIMKERERGLSESALKEWEQRTKGSNNPALPGVAPDVISPEGNITLGRGNPITPQQGPGRPKRVTQINEINLKKPEITPDKEVLDLQERLDVDTETAQEIQNTVEGFLAEIGANEEGVISGREVNYDRFSTKALNELMEDNILPQSEKNKIEDVLKTRTAETEAGDRAELDKEFAYRIKKLEEEELRVGKIGKNKVSKEIAKKQQDAVDEKRDRLIEEMRERYGGNEKMDQERGQDKFDELSQKSVDYANSYKRTTTYRTETAERQVLDSLMEGWKQQPKFVRDMADSQLKIRQEFINELELQNGYKLETTDYNDRYILEDNGQIVDRGAIKYNEDGKIEVTAQSLDGLRDSGLLSYLPENAIVKISGNGDVTTAKELRGTAMLSKGGNVPQFKEIKFPSRNLYELATEDPIEKFDGKLTPEQKTEGNVLYKIAKQKLDGQDIESDNEIIAARGKFLVMNQKPGYTKALGLDQGEVNKTITEWWEQNGGATEELKQFNRWINDGAKPQYWFTGISNLITYSNPWRNVDAINYLVKDVKTAENFDKATYKPRIDATIDSLLLIDSHFNHGELNVRFTTQSEMNKYALELAKLGATGEFLGDTLTLVAGQGNETIPHEIGHESDAVIGAELFGMKFIRNSGHSEWFATGKPAMEYLRNNGHRWHDGLDYKTPEALEFHREMIDLLNDIKVPEWMKNDTEPNTDGTPMSEYWTRPEEVWARFRQANVTLTRQMNQTGKVPKKTYKSRHGDIYDIELYKRWAQLLQKHQELADAGAFYKVEPINRSGISTANGLKDIEQKSLFEQTPGDTALERYFKEKPYNIDIMYKTYDPDILEWMNNIKKRFVGGEDITLNELYEVKNMMEQHSKEKGTQIDVPDGPTAQLLLEKAESMAQDKISTYDKKQIKKITGELSDLIQGYSDESIEIRGATYNPDVDIRQKKIDKIRLARKQYMANSDISLPHTSRLTSLKAKIEELSKYSVEDINNAIGMTDLQVKHFMEEIKPRIEELQAKGIEKAVTNLVALHNLDIVNFAPLIKDFKGKDPMPSIAVMDPNVPHEVFGDISLVFGRDTIDPKVDPANKIYGSDAWTPTFPDVKRSTEHIESFAKSLINDLFVDNGDVTRTDIVNISNTLHDALVDAKEVSKFEDMDPSEKWNYIKETLVGRNDRFKELITKYPGIDELMFDKVTGFIEDGGLEERKIIPARYFDTKPTYRNADQIAEELVEYVPEEVRKYYDEGESGTNMLIKDIKRTLQKWIGGGTANIVDALGDEYAMDVEDPKIGEIVDRLQYLEEGDRPLTSENVLEAMRNQRNNRETYPGTFEDMIEIEGTELNDVEDIRKQNFAKVFHGDRTGDLGDLKDRYYYILDTLSREYVPYDEKEATIPLVERVIKKAYDTDVNKFQKNMMEAYNFTEEIPNELLQRIIDVVEQGKKIPIRFSESKPERIVNLMEEVQYILVPEGKKANAVRKIVKDTPLESKVVEYTPDNFTAPRSRKLKELQKKYGNVFFSMGGVTMPIAMLYLMMKQEETA